MRSLFQNYLHILLAGIAAVTSDTAGASNDVGPGSLDDILAILVVGAVTGTSPTLDVKIQGSNDGSSWTDLGSFGQVTAANKSAELRIDRAGYRYLRSYSDVGGTSPSFTHCVSILVEKETGASDLNSATAA